MSKLNVKQAKKLQLLHRVRQQRQDLSWEVEDWLVATARYDRGWQKLVSLRKYMVAGSSLIALYSLRHPSRLVLWTKRALGMLGTVKVLRNALGNR